MSNSKYWSEMMGRPAGRTPPAETTHPPGNVTGTGKDGAIHDAFDDPHAYEAVRALHARSNDAYFFVLGREAPYVRPYAYFQGVDPLPDGSGLLVHWPGIRFEVRGDNLLPAIGRLSQRRADVWRAFRPGYHAAPGKGATVIHAIRAVLDDDAEGAALGGSASGLSR